MWIQTRRSSWNQEYAKLKKSAFFEVRNWKQLKNWRLPLKLQKRLQVKQNKTKFIKYLKRFEELKLYNKANKQNKRRLQYFKDDKFTVDKKKTIEIELTRKTNHRYKWKFANILLITNSFKKRRKLGRGIEKIKKIYYVPMPVKYKNIISINTMMNNK